VKYKYEWLTLNGKGKIGRGHATGRTFSIMILWPAAADLLSLLESGWLTPQVGATIHAGNVQQGDSFHRWTAAQIQCITIALTMHRHRAHSFTTHFWHLSVLQCNVWSVAIVHKVDQHELMIPQRTTLCPEKSNPARYCTTEVFKSEWIWIKFHTLNPQ